MDQLSVWKLRAFVAVLVLDAAITSLLWTPLVATQALDSPSSQQYTLYASVDDLVGLAVLRIGTAVLALVRGYVCPPTASPPVRATLRGPTSLDETVVMEAPLGEIWRRHVQRWPWACEVCVWLTGLWVAAKSLSRLHVEIGLYREAHAPHPVFWLVLLGTAVCAVLEATFVDSMHQLAQQLGRQRDSSTTKGNNVPATRTGQLAPLLQGQKADYTSLDSDECDEEEGDEQDDTEHDDSDSKANDSDESASAFLQNAGYIDLWRICVPDTLLVGASLGCMLVAGIANVFIPQLTGNVVDALMTPERHPSNDATTGLTPDFVRSIEWLVLASLMGGFFSGAREALSEVIGSRVNTRLRIQLLDSLLAQEIGFFDTTRTGDLSSRLSTSTWHAGQAVTSFVNVFLKSILMLLGYLVFMTMISWQLTLLATVTIPAVAMASKWYGRYLYSISILEEQAVADGCAVGESALSSMPTIRSLGSEHVELAEFERYMRKFLAYNTKGAWAILGYSTCVDALPELVVALVLYYGGLLVHSNGRGHITGGQLFGFVLYLNAMVEKFTDLGEMYTDLVRALGATDKVFELLKRESNLTQPSMVDPQRLDRAKNASNQHFLGVNATKVIVNRVSGLHPIECKGDIVFENVQFRYPARPKRVVLDGLNLTIPAGSVVALVGTSGSGKSSIVKLIQHLYEATSGTVSIDGVSVNELSADWISRHVAVVQQEPVLFAHSIRKNIVYGLEGTDMEPTQAEVEEAARLANAASFIEGLPDGYDTQVGERGIQLSGGQKQRIAIARSVVRRPRILLLDEATSALDSESETAVQEAIDLMIRGHHDPTMATSSSVRTMTVVVVAHRLSTVKNADRIVVLQHGRITEQGTHDALIAKPDGAYNTLIRKQLHHSGTPI